MGDVDQWAEWVWSRERVARSREDSRRLTGAEAPHQRGLADARLTADEHEAAGRGHRDGGEVVLQRGERFFPLEQIPRSCNGLRRVKARPPVNGPIVERDEGPFPACGRRWVTASANLGNPPDSRTAEHS